MGGGGGDLSLSPKKNHTNGHTPPSNQSIQSPYLEQHEHAGLGQIPGGEPRQVLHRRRLHRPPLPGIVRLCALVVVVVFFCVGVGCGLIYIYAFYGTYMYDIYLHHRFSLPHLQAPEVLVEAGVAPAGEELAQHGLRRRACWFVVGVGWFKEGVGGDGNA